MEELLFFPVVCAGYICASMKKKVNYSIIRDQDGSSLALVAGISGSSADIACPCRGSLMVEIDRNCGFAWNTNPPREKNDNIIA